MKQSFLYTLFVLFLLGQSYHVPAQTMMVAKDGTMQTLVPICLIDSIYATTSGLFLFAEADTLLVCDSLFLNSTLPDTLVIDYQTNHVAVTNPRIKQLNVSVHAHDVTVTSTGKTPFTLLAYLKKTDIKNGILTYRRRKTGQELTIKWEKCMAEIVAKYPENKTDFLLPIIKEKGNGRNSESHQACLNGRVVTDEGEANERRQYDNALHLVNYRLKELSTMLKLQRPLTMYVARHSWASAAKAKNVPLSVISEGMGHDSEATTQIYLASLETSVVDKANKMILRLL